MIIRVLMRMPIVKMLFLVGSSNNRVLVVPLGLGCGASRPLWGRSFLGMRGAYISCLTIEIPVTVVVADTIRIHLMIMIIMITRFQSED